MAANKETTNYSVVSYFSGCGGLDLGFRGGFRYHDEEYPRQPFDIIAAYDFEKHCVETYNQYFGEGSATVADLSKIDVNTVPEADLLIGGFPCQEFSSCGPLGGLESERGRLYQTLITYMKKYSPKMVIGENVINLERMEDGKVIQKIVSDLHDAGYAVEVWKMFAPDYGIPQRRTRLFFICIRNDIEQKCGFPEKPKPTHEGKYRSMRKWRSLLMSGWRMLLIWVTLMMRRDSHFRRDSNGKKTTI